MSEKKKPAAKKAPPKRKPPAKKAVKRVAKKVAPQRLAKPDAVDVYGLTDKQAEFVEHYLVDFNATQAAIRAGYSAATAYSIGHENLRKPEIAEAIRRRRTELAMAADITPERLVQELTRVLLADPRELVEVKVGCCRHCWGEGHRYQRTVTEMNMDRELWASKGNSMADFDEMGGIGFNPLRSPHTDCPECAGDGQPRTVLKDTRTIGPLGAALYAGAKQTKYGIEIQMRDKDAALDRLARIIGAYEKDNTQKTSRLAEALAMLSGNVLGPVDDGTVTGGPGFDDED